MSLASAADSPDCTSEGTDHLQPQSRAPLHPGLMMSSISPSPSNQNYWSSSQPMNSDGNASQYQNHINQKLLRYAHSQGFEHSPQTTQSDSSSIQYGTDSIKLRDDIGSDEYDSARSQAQVGTLKLELPVDEDDYLMPSPQQAQTNTTYVDLIDTKNSESNPNIFKSYSEFYKNNIDNPEYLMNHDAPPTQTIGLPTVSAFVNSASMASQGVHPRTCMPQKSVEEESDHEYYNDFDRLQRELQPLQQSKNGALV